MIGLAFAVMVAAAPVRCDELDAKGRAVVEAGKTEEARTLRQPE